MSLCSGCFNMRLILNMSGSLAKQPCLGEVKLSRAIPEAAPSLRFSIGFSDSLGRRKTMAPLLTFILTIT